MSKKIAAQVGVDITGKEKYEIMRNAISQYDLAFKKGFFLEATTLMESLMCNRMESRLAKLTNRDVNMDTLGSLCVKLIKNGENDQELLDIVDEIIIWKDQRNLVIHEAAKIGKDEKKDWDNFLAIAEEAAEDGRDLFNRYDKRFKQLIK